MKLEKFDYKIENKNAKKEFIALGVLCIALVVVVVLYKTFAKFSSSSDFNIIKAKVAGPITNEILRVDISKEGEGNEVFAVLYSDKTLKIEGTGYMKDFEGDDLIGEVLDAYINQNDVNNSLLSQEDKDFINESNKVNIMNAYMNYYGRGFITRYGDYQPYEGLKSAIAEVGS